MLSAVLILTGIALVAAIGLAFASRVFLVKKDPLVDQVIELLPGANCGACGLAGCSAYAEKLVANEADVTACSVADDESRARIAGLLGISFEAAAKRAAVIMCQGTFDHAEKKYRYDGVPSCRAAQLIAGADKECQYGCLGFGDCVRSCPFGALEVVQGLSKVNVKYCTACGNCVRACPRDLIVILPVDQKVHVLCSSRDKGKIVRKICDVGCIGCGKCAKVCPVEAIEFHDNIARIIPEKCIQCGACARVCPTHAIVDEGGPHYTAVINENCTGCTLCVRKCPAGAITGEKKQIHEVDPKKCVRCHLCWEACNFEAIELVDEQGAIMIPPRPRKKKKKAAEQKEATG